MCSNLCSRGSEGLAGYHLNTVFDVVQSWAGLSWSQCHGDRLPYRLVASFFLSSFSKQLRWDERCVSIINTTAKCSQCFAFVCLFFLPPYLIRGHLVCSRCVRVWNGSTFAISCNQCCTLIPRSKSQFLGLTPTLCVLAALYACTSILQKWLALVIVMYDVVTSLHKTAIRFACAQVIGYWMNCGEQLVDAPPTRFEWCLKSPPRELV